MAATLVGRHSYSGRRDADGAREYKVTYLVRTNLFDGPVVASNCPGLPGPGDIWEQDNDVDLWAYYRPDTEVKMHEEKPGEHSRMWLVTCTFTTRNRERCQDTEVENPILEPQKVSGSFLKNKEQATTDRWGRPLLNSAFEQLTGPQVEFDDNTPAIRIEQNVLDLELPLIISMRNSTNETPMWGLPPGTVKLSNFSFQRKYYGVCFPYYTRTFDFEVKYEGWHRVVLDEGTKALSGKWNPTTGAWDRIAVRSANGVTPVLNPTADGVLIPTRPRNPNPANPQHFIRFRDKQGELAKVILDGQGSPWNPPEPSEMTQDCEQCTIDTMMSTTLYAYGMTAGVSGNAGTARLTHQFDCTWTTTGTSSLEVTLLYDPVTGNWVLECPSNGTSWKRAGDQWDCEGLNGMVRFLGNGPPYVQVGIGDSSPGRIVVDKYGRSNFFLLGIPVVL